MRVDRAPATVVICCGVPHGMTSDEFAGWVRMAERAQAPISWVVRSDDMAAVLATLGLRTSAWDVAISLDTAQLSSRQSLRHEISAARRIHGGLECAVVPGKPSLDHRALLVEQGIHTVAVGAFDQVTRTSRRPPPAGWACRSVVWGLWEVQTVPQPPRPAVGRLLPWVCQPRLSAGSLTVVHVEPATVGTRLARTQVERLSAWIARQSDRVAVARLSDLPSLLRMADQPLTGSVLRRAA